MNTEVAYTDNLSRKIVRNNEIVKTLNLFLSLYFSFSLFFLLSLLFSFISLYSLFFFFLFFSFSPFNYPLWGIGDWGLVARAQKIMLFFHSIETFLHYASRKYILALCNISNLLDMTVKNSHKISQFSIQLAYEALESWKVFK